MVRIGTRTRQHYYDRDMDVIGNEYNVSIGAHSWTQRWLYTVPSGRIYNNGTCTGGFDTAIATDGKLCSVAIKVKVAGVWRTVFQHNHHSTTIPKHTDTKTALFSLKAGDQLQASSVSNDTINHQILVSAVGVEFEA